MSAPMPKPDPDSAATVRPGTCALQWPDGGPVPMFGDVERDYEAVMLFLRRLPVPCSERLADGFRWTPATTQAWVCLLHLDSLGVVDKPELDEHYRDDLAAHVELFDRCVTCGADDDIPEPPNAVPLPSFAMRVKAQRRLSWPTGRVLLWHTRGGMCPTCAERAAAHWVAAEEAETLLAHGVHPDDAHRAWLRADVHHDDARYGKE